MKLILILKNADFHGKTKRSLKIKLRVHKRIIKVIETKTFYYFYNQESLKNMFALFTFPTLDRQTVHA